MKKIEKLFNNNKFYKQDGSLKYNVIWLIAIPIIIYLGLSVIITTIFTFIYTIFHLDVDNFDLIIEQVQYNVYLQMLVQLATVIVFYFFYKKDKKNYPVTKDKLSTKTIIFGGLFIFVCALIFYIVELPLSYLFNNTYSDMVDVFVKQGKIFLIIITCILAPLAEELLFRGVILNRLLAKKGPWISIIVSAIIFGIAHGNLEQFVGAGMLGVALGYVYVKTRSLLPCILGHMLNNLLSCIEIFFVFSTKQSIIMYLIIIVLFLYPTIKFLQTKNRKIYDVNKIK